MRSLQVTQIQTVWVSDCGQMTMLNGVVGWRCWMALLDGVVGWRSLMVLLSGVVEWRC